MKKRTKRKPQDFGNPSICSSRFGRGPGKWSKEEECPEVPRIDFLDSNKASNSFVTETSSRALSMVLKGRSQGNHFPAVGLDTDMTYVCDALHINPISRALLTAFDATTLEDCCLLTNRDLEDFQQYAAQWGLPFAPLQRRKLNLLIQWLRTLVERWIRSVVDQREYEGPYDQGYEIESLRHLSNFKVVQANRGLPPPNSGSDEESDEEESPNEIEKVKEDSKIDHQEKKVCHSVIPPNWRKQFTLDLPCLKEALFDLEKRSLLSDWDRMLLEIQEMICCT